MVGVHCSSVASHSIFVWHTLLKRLKTLLLRPRRSCLQIQYLFVLFMVVFSGQAVAGPYCQSFPCTIVGSLDDDILRGTADDDVICGLSGNDQLFGLEGNDLICGGEGHDLLMGGDGQDRLYGGKGRDRLDGERDNDELDGGQGNDTLMGGSGADFLVGGAGRDAFEGTSLADTCDAERSEQVGACGMLDVTNHAQGKSFTTLGPHIAHPDGSLFIPRGVNIFPWHRSPATVDLIKNCWNFNMVRLHAWILDDSSSQWKDHVVYLETPLIFNLETTQLAAYDVKPLIDYLTSQELVVVFDVHEYVGGFFEGEVLESYLVFIRDFAERYKDNPYVWLDLHNEPGAYEGQQGDFGLWRHEVSTILSTVKNIAPDMMVLVSGTAWGQDTGPHWSSDPVKVEQSALLANADVLSAYNNVIGTFHIYDQWIYGTPRLQDFVSKLYTTLDKPILVGEYGAVNNVSTLSATRSLFELVQQEPFQGLGRTAWVWDAYDQNDLTVSSSGGGQAIDSCAEPGNLSELGRLVWDDNH